MTPEQWKQIKCVRNFNVWDKNHDLHRTLWESKSLVNGPFQKVTRPEDFHWQIFFLCFLISVVRCPWKNLKIWLFEKAFYSSRQAHYTGCVCECTMFLLNLILYTKENLKIWLFKKAFYRRLSSRQAHYTGCVCVWVYYVFIKFNSLYDV